MSTSMRCALPALSAVAVLMVACSVVVAQETDQTDAAQPTSADLDAWIEQLDDDKFAIREEATKKLVEAADGAIDVVQKAAASDKREVATRAASVLRQLAETGNDRATAALRKLSEHENAQVARRAQDVLDKIDEHKNKANAAAQAGNQNLPAGLPPQIRQQIQQQIQQQRIQGQIQLGGIAATTITVSDVNGVKTTTVKENDSKTVITEDPKNGINIEVTEQVNGKPKTTKASAKDDAELKKKHPDMHKIYEKYNGKNGIAVGGGGFGQFGVPRIQVGARPMFNALNGADAQAAKKSAEAIAKAKEKIQDALEKVKNLQANSENGDALEALHAVLEEAADELSAGEPAKTE